MGKKQPTQGTNHLFIRRGGVPPPLQYVGKTDYLSLNKTTLPISIPKLKMLFYNVKARNIPIIDMRTN